MSVSSHAVVRHGVYVVLQLPSGLLRPIQLQRNTTISIGKFGSFHSDSVIGRPYHLTYEILDKDPNQKHPKLRIVPAAELHEEAAIVDFDDGKDDGLELEDIVMEDSNGGTGAHTPDFSGRNNRLTVDDPSRQALSRDQIEELKREAATGSGKQIISRIMAAHSALDEKTVYSLAKYTLRKARKYMRRFVVLPMDVVTLTDLILDKDASKIMDLRHESLGLVTCWANVHHAGNVPSMSEEPYLGGGRWLVVDDTGGLVVAAMAEKMGLLYQDYSEANGSSRTPDHVLEATDSDVAMPNGNTLKVDVDGVESAVKDEKQALPKKMRQNPKDRHQSAVTNTITLVHPHAQPNVSLLKYFGFLPDDSSMHHPLYSNLHTVSWLQLLDPTSDQGYQEEPETVADEVLATWKTGRRGGYFRKRRRWARIRRVVDLTRQGGFDGLIVASSMKPETIFRHLVPLVKGGGHIVAYSPTVEPLSELMDYYSRERRAAFNEKLEKAPDSSPKSLLEDPDFPLDPTLTLLPSLQTVRAVQWQVLPARTHPLMISRGGAEGYVFTATKVLQPNIRAVARGKFHHKKRKAEADSVE